MHKLITQTTLENSRLQLRSLTGDRLPHSTDPPSVCRPVGEIDSERHEPAIVLYCRSLWLPG